MTNDAIKREADELMRACDLRGLLSGYAAWFVGGSYSYDLMAWRDLDIYALDPSHDVGRGFDVARALTERLAAKKAGFRDDVGGTPNGLYWGIKLGDERAGAWKLDLWIVDAASYADHEAYSAAMRARLTQETRAAILTIKDAYWRRPEYRDTVTSDHIYRAVLDRGVGSVAEFERFLANDSPPLER